MKSVEEIAKAAKAAAKHIATRGESEKNTLLLRIAETLRQNRDIILEANRQDVEAGVANGLTKSLIDRLSLNEKRIDDIARGVEDVAKLPDPVATTLSEWQNADGLKIRKVCVPFGVIGVIYEARPNVTVDVAALCLKSGNAALLRGSSTALNSNMALVSLIQNVLEQCGIAKEVLQLIPQAGHAATEEMLQLRGIIDLVIPRGSARLIQTVLEKSCIPVIETGAGNCHVYIHQDADYDMAEKIVINAKTQRPSVCNTIETILVHEKWAEKNLSRLLSSLRGLKVECRGCERSVKYNSEVIPATEKDWATEYLDYILAVKIVDSVDEAIEHINRYGTKHSEAIITNSQDAADKFLQQIDAAAVYHNASTRFTDGSVFGFGAEIGISTQKLHVRGPMGLNDLTTYKYQITGHGEIRG